VTLPLIVLAMHGPQAILGWILGAVLAACDGLVWAELGAAMPKAGGSYEYLRTIYGPKRWGRFLSFLYIWQLSFSAPLSIASGCVGLAQYGGYLWPALRKVYFSYQLPIPVPFVKTLPLSILLGPGHTGRHGVLRDRRRIAVRNIQSVTTVVRAALVGGDGYPDGCDPDRAAALSREPGVRVPSRRI